jgi:NADPH:quinone reductase
MPFSPEQMYALCFSSFGGTEVLEYKKVPIPKIQVGEVLLKMEAIGLNFADIYRRKGNYHLKGNPPYIAGYEGAGVVVQSQSGLYQIGDRIAFADVPFANAEYVAVPETHAIPLSSDEDFELAAAVLLQGLTAQYLVEDSHPVKAGEFVLIHAAAGGVGQFMIQFCKVKNAQVIGLTRGKDKLAHIERFGADHAILLDESWPAKVLEITLGKGVDVVYDSVGSTLQDSFAVTKECGHVVFYGMSGGDPALVDPRMLMDSSKSLSGGDLWSYLKSQTERERRAKELFNGIKKGVLRTEPPIKFKLADGAAAHLFLESGKSAGKVLLIP